MPTSFSPSVTVAAIVCEGGRYLMVEEETSLGIMYNQPAGHLEAGESLVDGAVREALEETARHFVPDRLLGVYLAQSKSSFTGLAVSYLRFAFIGRVGEPIAGRRLDTGILRTMWLTLDEIDALRSHHRSPLVMQCVLDHANGRESAPLTLLFTDPSALAAASL